MIYTYRSARRDGWKRRVAAAMALGDALAYWRARIDPREPWRSA